MQHPILSRSCDKKRVSAHERSLPFKLGDGQNRLAVMLGKFQPKINAKNKVKGKQKIEITKVKVDRERNSFTSVEIVNNQSSGMSECCYLCPPARRLLVFA